MIESIIKHIVQGENIQEIFNRYENRIPASYHKDFNKILTTYFGLYNELNHVGRLSNEFDLIYDISTKPKLSFHFGWESKLDGLWITFSNNHRLKSTLYALPISKLKTNTYAPYFLGGEMPAADLIKVNEKIMLFVSQENTPSVGFLEKISTKREHISDIIPISITFRQGSLLDVELNDPASVDTPASPEKDEVLREVFEKMLDIKAVGICYSGYPNKEIIPREDIDLKFLK